MARRRKVRSYNWNRPVVKWPTTGQLLRQLGTMLVVIVVWGLLLAGFIRITRPGAEGAMADTTESVPPPEPTTVEPSPLPTQEPTDLPPEATDVPVVEPTDTPPDATPAPTDTPPDPTQAPTPLPEPTLTVPPAPVGPLFAADVQPIFSSRCTQCHGPNRVENGVRLDSYENVMAGSSVGPMVIPGDPNASVLIEVVESGDMPRRGPSLTPAQIELLRAWVDAGALNN